MASDTITIALDGDVPLDVFSKATRLFQEMIASLTSEVERDAQIDWLLDDLRYGSSVLATRGYAEVVTTVHHVVKSSEEVFSALEQGAPIPFGEGVARPARELTRLVGGRVVALRLYTPEYEALIREVTNRRSPPHYERAYGIVTGNVENLYRRSRRFTLIDQNYRRSVSCHLEIGQEEIMRDAWGRKASVEGWISREVSTGRPVLIEDVRSVKVHHADKAGDFRRARGVLPRAEDEPRAEDVIRTVRDAG